MGHTMKYIIASILLVCLAGCRADAPGIYSQTRYGPGTEMLVDYDSKHHAYGISIVFKLPGTYTIDISKGREVYSRAVSYTNRLIHVTDPNTYIRLTILPNESFNVCIRRYDQELDDNKPYTMAEETFTVWSTEEDSNGEK